MAKPTLQIIVASTRPGRVGLSVAKWFEQVSEADDRFDVGRSFSVSTSRCTAHH